MKVGQRKQRSDKKKEVKAVIHVDLKDTICRLSYITHIPVKDVCEFMIVHAMNNRETIDTLSKWFKRTIQLDSSILRGFSENVSVEKRINGTTERVTIRFNQADYNFIPVLAYAMDCSASRVVAILLELAFQDINLINTFIKQHLNEQLTPMQMKELRNLLKHLNRESDENSTWASLMLVILDEVTAPVAKLKDAVGEFLVNIRNDDRK